jgi:adenine-specific DNA-methyltransferase
MNNIRTFSNRVINADCLAVLPRLPDASVDLVFTDPPYLVNYHDRQGRSIANDSDDAQWLKPAFAQAFRVLKPGRFCVSFYGWQKADIFMQASWPTRSAHQSSYSPRTRSQ